MLRPRQSGFAALKRSWRLSKRERASAKYRPQGQSSTRIDKHASAVSIRCAAWTAKRDRAERDIRCSMKVAPNRPCGSVRPDLCCPSSTRLRATPLRRFSAEQQRSLCSGACVKSMVERDGRIHRRASRTLLLEDARDA